MKASYTFAFGEFGEYLEYSRVKFAIFMIFSFFIPLVMMNLLIAIMSDSYARIQENAVVTDARSLAGMILETEQLVYYYKLYISPESVKSSYYFLFYSKEITNEGDDSTEMEKMAENIMSIQEQLK